MSHSRESVRALIVNKDRHADHPRQADFTASVKEITLGDLPEGNVTVAIHWTDLNYKDALAVTDKGPVVQTFPMVPGIDFSGVVVDSADSRFAVGDQVLLTGWGAGEKSWGGFATHARVSGDWLLPLSVGLGLREAMIHGTAGFTAMLCVDALTRHQVDQQGEILVTGASGGVGSIVVLLMARLGYRVVGVTGRSEQESYLLKLGATRVIGRAELARPCRPLESQRWAGVIDSAGALVLATAIAQTVENGVVAACGLAGGQDLPTTVLPFILRGVTLCGINSVYCSPQRRKEIWARLSELLPEGVPGQVVREIGLDQVIEYAGKMMANKVRGRILVNLKAKTGLPE